FAPSAPTLAQPDDGTAPQATVPVIALVNVNAIPFVKSTSSGVVPPSLRASCPDEKISAVPGITTVVMTLADKLPAIHRLNTPAKPITLRFSIGISSSCALDRNTRETHALQS